MSFNTMIGKSLRNREFRENITTCMEQHMEQLPHIGYEKVLQGSTLPVPECKANFPISHISHALSFPTHALEAFPIPEGSHMMNFEAVDATDNAWRFCLSTRMTGAHPKPVLLRSSWGRFVEQKGLAPEDRVVFFMERDEVNDMIRRCTVRAQRKVMTLMGQHVWVDVEDLPLYGI